MGRREGPFNRDGTPLGEFAFWLRNLRNSSGLTYASLANHSKFSTTTLQEAGTGRKLPTLQVTMAIVRACGGPADAWHRYWTEVRQATDPQAPAERRSVEPPPEVCEPVRLGLGPGSPIAGGVMSESAASAANEAAGFRAEAPDGWYVESFEALLRLDTPQPEAVERRVIVAAVDGLSEVATSISVPRHPQDATPLHVLDAELAYGGSLHLREQPFESYFRHVIALPRPLRRGERHEYELRLRVPPGQLMAPHYVYVPFCRSDRFELRVSFGTGRRPAELWALDGVPPAYIYEREAGRALAPDRFGLIRATFRDLQLGHGYGVRWREPDQPVPDGSAPG